MFSAAPVMYRVAEKNMGNKDTQRSSSFYSPFEDVFDVISKIIITNVIGSGAVEKNEPSGFVGIRTKIMKELEEKIPDLTAADLDRMSKYQKVFCEVVMSKDAAMLDIFLSDAIALNSFKDRLKIELQEKMLKFFVSHTLHNVFLMKLPKLADEIRSTDAESCISEVETCLKKYAETMKDSLDACWQNCIKKSCHKKQLELLGFNDSKNISRLLFEKIHDKAEASIDFFVTMVICDLQDLGDVPSIRSWLRSSLQNISTAADVDTYENLIADLFSKIIDCEKKLSEEVARQFTIIVEAIENNCAPTVFSRDCLVGKMLDRVLVFKRGKLLTVATNDLRVWQSSSRQHVLEIDQSASTATDISKAKNVLMVGNDIFELDLVHDCYEFWRASQLITGATYVKLFKNIILSVLNRNKDDINVFSKLIARALPVGVNPEVEQGMLQIIRYCVHVDDRFDVAMRLTDAFFPKKFEDLEMKTVCFPYTIISYESFVNDVLKTIQQLTKKYLDKMQNIRDKEEGDLSPQYLSSRLGNLFSLLCIYRRIKEQRYLAVDSIKLEMKNLVNNVNAESSWFFRLFKLPVFLVNSEFRAVINELLLKLGITEKRFIGENHGKRGTLEEYGRVEAENQQERIALTGIFHNVSKNEEINASEPSGPKKEF